MPPAQPGAKCSPASTHPHWSGPLQDRLGLGRRGFASVRVPEQTTQALGELARSCHTTVSTVLQGAWAVLLTSLTGKHDVAFGHRGPGWGSSRWPTRNRWWAC